MVIIIKLKIINDNNYIWISVVGINTIFLVLKIVI